MDKARNVNQRSWSLRAASQGSQMFEVPVLHGLFAGRTSNPGGWPVRSTRAKLKVCLRFIWVEWGKRLLSQVLTFCLDSWLCKLTVGRQKIQIATLRRRYTQFKARLEIVTLILGNGRVRYSSELCMPQVSCILC